MEKPLSSQEIVFWFSLFGLDFGVPLMLPERWRFQIGTIATVLSFVGLIWSLGAMNVPDHIGWRELVVLMLAGAITSTAVRIWREHQFPNELYDSSHGIAEFVGEVGRKYSRPHILHENAMEWPKVTSRFKRHFGQDAVSLVRETRNPAFRSLAQILTHPPSVIEINRSGQKLNEVANRSEEYRGYRLIRAILIGLVSGTAAFIFFYGVLALKHR